MLLFLVLTACFSGILALNSEFHNPNCVDGRVAIVHLFEWKFSDIAAECVRFLGPMGYCGVQLSPPNEHALLPEEGFPWWQRYQPVSYDLTSRSGTEDEFHEMVQICNEYDVRIYVDVIPNHMTPMGREGYGIGGSYYNADTGEFPAVPYTMEDFHDCSACGECCCTDSDTNFDIVRNCRLFGLIDINQTHPHASQMIVDYMNKLIGHGVAGFEIDAAKHVNEHHLRDLMLRTDYLNTDWFLPFSRPFVYSEVQDLGFVDEIRGQWYTNTGMVSEFRYGFRVKEAVEDLENIEDVYDPEIGMLDSEDALVFVDNHDNQRGHGTAGEILTHKEPRDYKLAQAITLGYTYGYPRVMSSYDFEHGDQGPPSDAGDGSIDDVPILPDGSCGGGWICEHRWQAIAGMVSFAKATNGHLYWNKWTGDNSVAFSRGTRGFVAMTNTGIDETIYTGLPPGDYCNVITGCATNSGCEGETVTVNEDGTAHIQLPNSEDPILAIHVEAMSGSEGCIDESPGVPTTPTPTTPIPTPPRKIHL